jgi:thioredoxin-related protein
VIRTVVLGFLLAVVAGAQSPSEMKYNPKADPRADLQAALTRASTEGKNVLMDVGGEWCSWCHRMDKFLTENAVLLDLLQKNYVVVKVNFSDENKNETFLAGYPKVEGYPHLFVLDATGKLLESKNTGDLEEGKGYNLDRYREFLAKFARKR